MHKRNPSKIKVKKILNFIDGKLAYSSIKRNLKKFNPHNGKLQKYVAISGSSDVDYAVRSSLIAFKDWSAVSPVNRGKYLKNFVHELESNRDKLERLVSLETAKSLQASSGEVSGAILQGDYFAGEGMRLYGRSLTSSNHQKSVFTSRYPHGVVGLIVPANTPIANIAWKIFPALICGNSCVLKASEDAPELANQVAKLAIKSGLPKGLINIIHGDASTGRLLVEHPLIKLISFTGSSSAGIDISSRASKYLKRVSLELGGKNPFVVSDDCNLEKAVDWALLSAFSNAGQRCAAGSRLIVFEKIYDSFKKEFLRKMSTLKLGVSDECDLGPVINLKQYKNILRYFKLVSSNGGKIEFGGKPAHIKSGAHGYYILPSLISGLEKIPELYDIEVFGPVTHIEKVKDLDEAIKASNNTRYGLTASIHTSSISKSLQFSKSVMCGFVNVNLGTFGSEPHFPFGGYGLSGNGTREPGIEALDVYSELKNISISE